MKLSQEFLDVFNLPESYKWVGVTFQMSTKWEMDNMFYIFDGYK